MIWLSETGSGEDMEGETTNVFAGLEVGGEGGPVGEHFVGLADAGAPDEGHVGFAEGGRGGFAVALPVAPFDGGEVGAEDVEDGWGYCQLLSPNITVLAIIREKMISPPQEITASTAVAPEGQRSVTNKEEVNGNGRGE